MSIVAVTSAEDPTHFDQPWQLHWEPESGPYPTFDGTLTIHADETLYDVDSSSSKGRINRRSA